MNLSSIRAIAIAVSLLLAVYLPAFAATVSLWPPLPVAISLIMDISLCAALIAMVWLSRRGTSFAAFGFAASPVRSMIPAIAIGVPLALGGAWLASAFPSPAPIDIASLEPSQQVLFFVIAAPVQEEIIFRGLIQSILQKGAAWSSCDPQRPTVKCSPLHRGAVCYC